jgi:putative membrane protein
MRLIVWLFRAFLFFTLFAFALNNQQRPPCTGSSVWQWNTPLVIVVLVAFSGGCVIGVLAMVPQLVAPAPPGPAQRDARNPCRGRRPLRYCPSEFGTADHPPRGPLSHTPEPAHGS